MEKLKYYVLGIEGNEMLKKYREDYFFILRDKLNSIKESSLFEKLYKIKDDKEFLLTCDNSSRIEYLYNAYNSSDGKLYGHNHIIDGFVEDIDYYISNKKINSSKAKKIGDTNIYLTDFDRNPYNGTETHPDHFKKGVVVGFGEKEEDYWIKIYADTFEALKSIDKGIYDELNYIIQKIVPLGTAKDVHNSASYKEAIGHLYMGLSISDRAGFDPVIPVLEAIIHESSHNKLNLINKFDDLLLNDYELRYYSPYRPDARHIWGIFLGIHAFVPTIYTLLRYYKKNNLSDDNLLKKLVVYNIKNNLSLKVLGKYAKFTDIGNEIMEEVKYVMGLTNKELKELNIQEGLLIVSKEEALNHYAEVRRDYPYLRA